MNKILVVAIIFSVILGILIWRFYPLLNRQQGPVELIYWDFWDENSIRPILVEFEKTHPDIKITYTSQSPLNYRVRVQTQIREGVGPDIFPIHNSWLPMFSGDLVPSPMQEWDTTDYRKTFYPVVVESFTSGSQIFAAPLGIDGLALFVNEDILNAVGVEVPKSWQELISVAAKLTVKDQGGSIKTAGAALGTTGNVDYWSDLLGLLLLQQPGVDLKNPNSNAGAEVLTFYTSFVTDPTKKIWDVNLPKSSTMFIQGNLAFYFAPFTKVAEIKASNPTLRFKVAPLPQLPGRQVAWGSFWGEAVSAKTKHPKEAWAFVKFLTSKEVSRSFAVPYARMDLAMEQAQDPFLGAFVTQGPYYKFWYLSLGTGDNGINEEMIRVWEEAVNKVLAGQRPEAALQPVSLGVKQILDKYGK